jgi:co-chaperonin GroES (HSP10)
MINPLRDRIAVRPNTRKLSDIIIVENTEKFNEGTIFAIGPMVDQAKVGDFIKYGNGTYLDFPVFKDADGEEFQIIQEADICAILED